MEVVFVEERPIEGAQRQVRAGMTVGRAGADFELADPEVSRRHAVFHQVDSGIGVEDLGSRNGTHVNERRIEGITALSDGDRVRFGNTVWRLGVSHAAARSAPAAAAGENPDRMPTSLRRVMPHVPVYGEVPDFDAVRSPSPILGGSAARRLEATVISYLVVLGTAVGVALYFVNQ